MGVVTFLVAEKKQAREMANLAFNTEQRQIRALREQHVGSVVDRALLLVKREGLDVEDLLLDVGEGEAA